MSDNEVYVCFDSNFVYLFIGRECDPVFVQDLFEVSDINQINLSRNEETMFSAERLAISPYLNNLYGLINQIRY